MDLKGENFILEGEKFNGERKNAKYRNWLSLKGKMRGKKNFEFAQIDWENSIVVVSSTRIRLSSWKP